jgi:hypothetical protein
MPYLIRDPVTIIKATLGYKGIASPWGVSNLIYLASRSHGPAPKAILTGISILTYGLLI